MGCIVSAGSRKATSPSAAAKGRSAASERQRRDAAAARVRSEEEADAAGRAARAGVTRKVKGIEEEVDDMLAELKKKMGKL